MGSGRNPEKDSKTAQIIFRGKNPEDDAKIRWLKSWLFKNDKTYYDLFFPVIEQTATIHGYPDGHSQTVLDHAEKPRLLPLWQTCSHSNKKIIKGSFGCNFRGSYVKSPENCEQQNSQRIGKNGFGCYEADKK